MHDLGGLVWIVIVLIGVISSISKNAKKARTASRNRQRSAPQIPAQAQAFVPPASPPPQVHLPKPPTPMGRVMPPVVAPAPVAAALPQPDFPHPQAAHVGTPVIRGMFQGPATLIRAIVAAEVLGPPKSLQEPSIWNPPHSEPSI